MKYNHYQGNIEINPLKQYFKGHIQFTYIFKENSNHLELYLYKNFTISNIKCNAISNYEMSQDIVEFCPFISHAKRILLYFNRQYKIGENIDLIFYYQGNVPVLTPWTTNRIEQEFIELGIYTPYYPLTKDLQEATFDFKVNLPSNYELINGQRKNITWKIKENLPHNDATLIASHHFYKLHCKDNLTIYYIDDDDKHAVVAMNDACQSILDSYTSLFTKLKTSNHLSIVIVPRIKGGGYSRPKLIVFSKNVLNKNNKLNIRYLAHELAHLWWNKSINTNSWEDWLNESFAEYSALLFIRTYEGEDKFFEYIKKYEEKSKGLPPIYQISRDHPKAHDVLYLKGAYILYQLENKIGRKQFINFLKQVHLHDIRETKHLLQLLTDLEGKDISMYLDNKLKKVVL